MARDDGRASGDNFLLVADGPAGSRPGPPKIRYNFGAAMPPRTVEIDNKSTAYQDAGITNIVQGEATPDPKMEYDTVTVTKYVNVPVIQAYTTYLTPEVTTGYAPLPKPIDEAISPWIPVAPRPQYKMYYRADEPAVWPLNP